MSLPVKPAKNKVHYMGQKISLPAGIAWAKFLIASALYLSTLCVAAEVRKAIDKPKIFQHLARTTLAADFLAEFGEPARVDIPILLWPAAEEKNADYMTRLANGYWLAIYERNHKESEEIAVIFEVQPKVVKQTSALINVVPQLVVIWPQALIGLDIQTIDCTPYCSREHLEKLAQARNASNQPLDYQ